MACTLKDLTARIQQKMTRLGFVVEEPGSGLDPNSMCMAVSSPNWDDEEPEWEITAFCTSETWKLWVSPGGFDVDSLPNPELGNAGSILNYTQDESVLAIFFSKEVSGEQVYSDAENVLQRMFEHVGR